MFFPGKSLTQISFHIRKSSLSTHMRDEYLCVGVPSLHINISIYGMVYITKMSTVINDEQAFQFHFNHNANISALGGSQGIEHVK